MRFHNPLLLLVGAANAQQIGMAKAESHLSMPIQHCTKAAGCSFLNTSSVLDSNWRWTHHTGCTNSSKCNCYLGNKWMNETCSGVEECTQVCALDGEDDKGYKEKYGIGTDGQGLMNLTFVTHYQREGSNGTNVGTRMYLMEDDDHYKTFDLLNREITFTVDASKLPCGLNGALYFVEMDADGGKAKYPTNKAGARYGTGYCDAQCPHDLKWIEGEANLIGWNSSGTDTNVGYGKYGTCCAELDIWEANKVSTQMTVHSCTTEGAYRCEGKECGDDNKGQRFDGVCDKNGCDANPYRQGDTDFYGPGASFKIDSTKPVTVVTQFITDDGTDAGELSEMRRYYIQDNKTIHSPNPSYAPDGHNLSAISEGMCKTQMSNFSDRYDVFAAKGGLKGMGEAMRRKMTLVFSIWDDHDVGMTWLDAIDPYPINPAAPWGAKRGSCDQKSGNYSIVEKAHPDAYVLYSDVRYGEIGSTTGPSGPPPPPSCPGGSLNKCIAQCPTSPAPAYKACLESCVDHCNTATMVEVA